MESSQSKERGRSSRTPSIEYGRRRLLHPTFCPQLKEIGTGRRPVLRSARGKSKSRESDGDELAEKKVIV